VTLEQLDEVVDAPVTEHDPPIAIKKISESEPFSPSKTGVRLIL
jgi:hypothetical protein